MTQRPSDPHQPGGVRLQKVLAAAGVGSRRACEAMIAEGRVTVDGQKVREQGMRVDPETSVVHVDGLRVTVASGRTYIALNKPAGVISAMSDPEGRPTLADYVPNREARLFHVGRLDADTEGLILLTNDGELAHRLSHPSYGVRKTYLAEVAGRPARDVGKRLKDGVELDDGPVKIDEFRVVGQAADRVMVELVLHEGRKHVVRRVLDEVGLPVLRLVRTRIGPVLLGDIRPGHTRELGRVEVGRLYADVGL